MFSSSGEVFSWLAKFINLERGQKPKSFRLDRMQFLTELAGNPQRCAPSIHIAGSKGKGSVTGMLAAMLTAAGFRAARYMSPHVIDIRERITCGDVYFSEEIYCAAGNELRVLIEERLSAVVASTCNPLFDESTADGCEPTYFELLTLFFFLCAKHGKCDVMVIETGMGGRLDSTNIVDPLVSVITLIELEHTAFLGDTIAKVAGEKAGIIKQGRPVVLAKQREEALEIFKKTALEKNSPLFYLPDIANLSDIKVNPRGTEFDLSLSLRACASQNFSIPIPGKIQAENAALAIAALKTAFPQIGEDAVREGLKNLSIPARFEKITETGSTGTPPVIIDGAHTPESLEQCVQTFCSLYGESGVLLFGCAADKDAAAMAEIAQSRFAKIFITTPGTFKTSDPSAVYEAFRVFAGEKTQLVADTREAVSQAVGFAKNSNLPVLGTGSFYLVSEIRKIIDTS